jgi:acyl dehydratase
MVIGIKYCGGCNPLYNRTKRILKLKEANPEHEYVTPSGDVICDYWVVVCGCSRRCADIRNLRARVKVVVVWDEDSFKILEEELKKQNREELASVQEKRMLSLRETITVKRTITKEDTEIFARLTGDESRLHWDSDIAIKAGFNRPLVHGMFIDSLVSALMGTNLPGSGTVFMEHNTRFIRPVYWGDTLEITVQFISCEELEESYIGIFCGICKNQQGDRVLSVMSKQMMRKTLFSMTGEKE